jgi:hypothetical protein
VTWTCTSGDPHCLCKRFVVLESIPPPRDERERAMCDCLLGKVFATDRIEPTVCEAVSERPAPGRFFAYDEIQARIPRMHGGDRKWTRVAVSTDGSGPRWRPRRPRFATLRAFLGGRLVR